MISAISKVITNPTLVNIAQNADASVTCKTVVNTIGRPGFILVDNNIDLETKKYAATKEFLYQASSLAIYMALIVPFFKKKGFQFAKKYIYKGEEGFNKFKGMKEYVEYRKLAEKSRTNRTATLSKDHSIHKFEHDGLRDDLLNNDKPELYNSIKGSIELSNIVGSIVGLSILAPNVSQALIRPVLKFFNMDKNPEDNRTEQTKIDTKA